MKKSNLILITIFGFAIVSSILPFIFPESIFDPNIPDDYILIDPANTAEKAELGLLCILPFNVVLIAYEYFKKRRNGKDNT